jgi:hypothetical protein
VYSVKAYLSISSWIRDIPIFIRKVEPRIIRFGYIRRWLSLALSGARLTEDSSIASEAGVCGCASLSFLLHGVDTMDLDWPDRCSELRREEAKREEHGWDSRVARSMVV